MVLTPDSLLQIKTNKSPEYLYNVIPPVNSPKCDLRHIHIFQQPVERTNRFSSTYFQNCPYEWNKLDLSIQLCENVLEFKRKLVQLGRPSKNCIFGIHDIIGTKLLTRLRIEFSDLRSYKFKHSFSCSNPSCQCLTGIENNKHYLLHCPHFTTHRRKLLDQVSSLTNTDLIRLSSKELCDLLLYGHPDFTLINNKKRSHTQLDSRKQVIAFQDRVITINIKEAQHPLKREKQVIDKSSIMLKISTKSMHRMLV